LAFIDVAEMSIVADIDGDVVVVDGTGDEPLVGDGGVVVAGGPAEAAVGDVDEGLGYRDGDTLAVGLLGLTVLVRPPGARAKPLHGGGDPGLSVAIDAPGESAVPRGVLRHARSPVIEHGDGADLTHPARTHRRHVEDVAVAAMRHAAAILDDA